MHKSAAWPLTWMYCTLVVYASLYPFTDWRDQGIAPWAFLAAPLPRYWTGFDVAINIVGYLPLGALLAWLALRTRHRVPPAWLALACGTLLSLVLETLQSYLPQRVASREDWLLNTLGTLAGALTALYLAQRGGVARWDRWQQRWLAPQSRGVLVLLLSWPAALLFPSAVPFGLGHVWGGLQDLAQGLFGLGAHWMDDAQLPPLLSAIDAGPLGPVAALACVITGLLAPCLLGFGVLHRPRHRIWLSLAVVFVGVSASGLSAALSWGPAHMWAWLDATTLGGLALALALAIALVRLRWRWAAALVLVLLCGHVALLNQAPESPYFAQTLQSWEQGRFVRFNGLAEWLGWLWPYAAIALALSRIRMRSSEPKIGT
jgi:VanZ family protein